MLTTVFLVRVPPIRMFGCLVGCPPLPSLFSGQIGFSSSAVASRTTQVFIDAHTRVASLQCE
jgi:hypothetical protein